MKALETYTLEKTLAEQMNALLERKGISVQAAADEMGISRSTLSKYLNGKYNSDATEIERKAREVLEAHGEDSGPCLRAKTEYFESRDYKRVLGICRACQEQGGLAIVVGKTGRGKTHTLKKYAELPRVVYIECDDAMACRDLVEAIEAGIGMPRGYGGTIWSRTQRIREFFSVNEGYLLIIDEADKLISKYTQKKMEILRGIYDQSSVGVLIAGEPRLESELRNNLARFANRVDFYCRLEGLTKKEVEGYLDGYEIEDAALAELTSRATNPQTGCFRLLDRTLSNVLRILNQRGETKVTMKVVREASQMMML